ncbi:hypothetical protein AMS68_001730 [Peltaster fructicola]|uniref:Choline kinase N-terminal domain-containing protein n=1 Tax=Peltaster fructicola TaxID=286661 RepID=A0A6H0XNB3_9PEZI|nr:hypothetical protein AMS68_001730 [Peltaster fructicola]
MPQGDQQDGRPVGILKPESRDCASPSSYLGLSYSVSPKATPKSVSIAPDAEVVSPLFLGRKKSVEGFQLEENSTPRRIPVKGPGSRKLSGRPAYTTSPALQALAQITGNEDKKDHSTTHISKHLDHVIEEVATWLKEQRARRVKRKLRKAPATPSTIDEVQTRSRRISDASIASDDFDRLEDIIKNKLGLEQGPRRLSHRRRPSLKHHRVSSAGASSDTDYHDGDILVPSCDSVLDNSKTLAYTGGASDSSDESEPDELTRIASFRDVDAWTKFKFEIVRLSHTLRLKGWRRVPLDTCSDITVERLSGALTNAVYVVSPPDNLPEPDKDGARVKRKPQKLLLRIYGPQVEHLIDREAELQILQRLARKRIGPRMLGTFANGRFEEFFNARPLTPEDLRNPDTSRQIAKRMRELHDGIEVLDEERDCGAFVWRNWDKWEQRVEQVVTWLDDQIRAMPPGTKPTGDEAWKRRSFICGVEWKHFREVVKKYRAWLDEQYGGLAKVNEQLVFAHNDTQYGNILRLVPSGESPLLLPANTHKQLVVIDFEYANANLPGLEFANHFTEWCYNYHDKRKPYACNTQRYPTAEEQDRFVRSYVRHRPENNTSTPKLAAQRSSDSPRPNDMLKRNSSSITNFMLDARTPGKPMRYDESAELAAEDVEVARLLHETRLWRLANSAQWVAWGIVQAKVPRMPDFEPQNDTTDSAMNKDAQRAVLEEMSEEYEAVAKDQAEAGEEEQEEFDYLGYAQHRAMFFWGDAIQLGFVKAEDLPGEMRSKIKTVLC